MDTDDLPGEEWVHQGSKDSHQHLGGAIFQRLHHLLSGGGFEKEIDNHLSKLVRRGQDQEDEI